MTACLYEGFLIVCYVLYSVRADLFKFVSKMDFLLIMEFNSFICVLENKDPFLLIRAVLKLQN